MQALRAAKSKDVVSRFLPQRLWDQASAKVSKTQRALKQAKIILQLHEVSLPFWETACHQSFYLHGHETWTSNSITSERPRLKAGTSAVGRACGIVVKTHRFFLSKRLGLVVNFGDMGMVIANFGQKSKSKTNCGVSFLSCLFHNTFLHPKKT